MSPAESDVLETRPSVASNMAAQDFTIRKLSPLFAAEVVGLDLRRPLREAVRHQVYDAFVRYHVLAFRDQQLTKDEQIAFSEQFGTLERHIARNRGSDNPWVHMVSNLGTGRPSVRQSQVDGLAHRQIIPAGAVAGDNPACSDDAARRRRHVFREHVCRL